MSHDKRTIGIVPRNQRVLDSLMNAGSFSTEIDAAKFAFAIAAKRGLPSGSIEGASSKWNVGSFDPDQSLRLVVESIYNDVEEPYRLVEYLINSGLEAIDTGADVPPDVFGELFPSGAAPV